MAPNDPEVPGAQSRIDAAFRSAPRAAFLPAAQRRFADLDAPLPIGHGQTNSQPSTVRTMLELLDVRPDHRVLDLGCGSGWTTALLAHLGGRVDAVERIPELTRRCRATLVEVGVLDSRGGARVHLHQAVPGVLGWPAAAPFDRILVSAAPPELPEDLLDQLAPGGILVIPVAGRMHRLCKDLDGRIEDEVHGGYSFVPLVEDHPHSDG